MLFKQSIFRFKPKSPTLLGLDIDRHAVRLVEVVKGHGYQLRSCSQVPIQLENSSTGFGWDNPLVIAALRRAIDESDLQTRHVAIALPHSAVLFKTVELDKTLHDREIEAQIRERAEQYFNYPLSELMLDFEVLDTPAQHPNLRQIRWVAARRQEIETRLRVLAAVGLHAKIIEVDNFALQRVIVALIQRDFLPSQQVATLHISESAILLIVMQQQQVVYTRLENYVGADDCQPILAAPILTATARALQLFVSSTTQPAVAMLLLSGSCLSNELAQSIQQHTNIPVNTLQPFKLLEQLLERPLVEPLLKPAENPIPLAPEAFAVCVGLAMRVSDEY